MTTQKKKLIESDGPEIEEPQVPEEDKADDQPRNHPGGPSDLENTKKEIDNDKGLQELCQDNNYVDSPSLQVGVRYQPPSPRPGSSNLTMAGSFLENYLSGIKNGETKEIKEITGPKYDLSKLENHIRGGSFCDDSKNIKPKKGIFSEILDEYFSKLDFDKKNIK